MVQLLLPEKDVSGVSLCLCGNEVLISAKNGDKVTLLKSRDFERWERKILEKNYSDKTVPIISHIPDDIGIFISKNYVPYLKSLETGRSVSLKTPYLKKAVISGHPVILDGLFLVPGYGIPYGCKLVSPVLFERDHNRWFLRSFISLSEDFGVELRHTVLTFKRDVLYAFVGSSFPFYHVFVAKSYDFGKTWTKPKMTGISGLYPVAVVSDDNLIVACYNRDEGKIEIFSESVEEGWERVKCYRVGERIISLDGTLFNSSLLITAAFNTGEAQIINVPL